MSSNIAIGIDLGTTYSCVGVWENDRVEIIANDLGNRTTPSYVAFTEEHRLVGESAKNQVAVNPSNTVFDAKRLIGRQFKDDTVQSDMKHWPFRVVDIGGLPKILISWRGEDKLFAPEEISGFVLSKMKNIAESYLGKSVTDAVITVPAYFNDSQRQSTKDAGRIAGLNVLRIINEPTSAAIAYGLDKQGEDGEKLVLIYDLGGGTFDVSLLSIEKGIFEVRATAGDTHLGGEDFDNRMVDFFVDEFKKKNKGLDISTSQRSLRRLRTVCERAKRTLSSQTVVEVEVDALFDGIDFSATLSRAKFEDLCSDLFKSTLDPVRRVLGDAKTKITAVQEIVLVGGSTRIPKVQALLSEFFNGKKLNKSVNQDEAVAFGATVQAAILSGAATGSSKTSGLLLLDVIPLSLGVETAGGVMTKIIKRNSTVPIRREQTFSTNIDNQDGVDVTIYEGERAMVADNHLLGSFTLLGFKPMLKGIPQIEVTFDIDSNGILNVTAIETSTGVASSVVIENTRAALTVEDVDLLVKEAEENKAKDAIALLQLEAKNDLDAYAYQVASVLRGEEASKILDEDELEEVMELVDEVMEWLDDNANAKVEDINNKKKQLKEAVKGTIDKITPPPPSIKVNECIFSPGGALIEFID